jgi:hypothetical protein
MCVYVCVCGGERETHVQARHLIPRAPPRGSKTKKDGTKAQRRCCLTLLYVAESSCTVTARCCAVRRLLVAVRCQPSQTRPPCLPRRGLPSSAVRVVDADRRDVVLRLPRTSVTQAGRRPPNSPSVCVAAKAGGGKPHKERIKNFEGEKGRPRPVARWFTGEKAAVGFFGVFFLTSLVPFLGREESWHERGAGESREPQT